MLDYLVGDLIEHIVYITEMPYTCVSPQHNGSVRTHIVCFENKLKQLSGFSQFCFRAFALVLKSTSSKHSISTHL